MNKDLRTALRLFIDANLLPQSVDKPSAAAERLFELASERAIKLLAPDIAINEVRTRLVAGTRQTIRTILDGLGKLERDPLYKRLCLDNFIRTASDEFRANLAVIEQTSYEHMHEILTHLNGAILHPSQSTSNRVFDAYFAGSQPFAKPKERNHLPDAFIFVILQRYAKLHKCIICAITSDRKLGEIMRREQEFIVFESIEEFLVSSELARALAHVQDEHAWLKRLQVVSRWLLRFDRQISADICRKISSQEISTDLNLSSSGNSMSASINDLEIDAVEIEYGYPRSYGPGRVGFSFECRGSADIEFHVDENEPWIGRMVRELAGDLGIELVSDTYARVEVVVDGTAVVSISNWQRGRAQHPRFDGVQLDDVLHPQFVERDLGAIVRR